MTKENYTILSNRELLSKINNIKVSSKHLTQYLNNYYFELLEELIYRTHFLDDFYQQKTVPILARLYCIEHDLLEQPKCSNPNCDNVVEWRNGIHQFAEYCSLKCCKSDPKTIEHTKSINLERYGTDNPNQLDWVKQKRIQTCLEKYGVEHPQQCERIKNKIKTTIRNRYGCDNVFQSEEIKAKIKQTNLKHLGCEHPMQSVKTKEKIKQTCRLRYGCDYTLQSKNVRKKSTETLKRIYGVDNPMKSIVVRNKALQTCLKKYSVPNFTQTCEYHKKAHKRYTNPKYPDMTFGSSWEFLVYDFLLENHIDFEYQPAISLPYDYQGTHHTYHPDFLVNGKLYEVKGDNFFRINESTGNEEMFCPYRDEDWSNEKYDWMCGLYEAKHQCMLANDVTILRKLHIENLSINTFE